MNVCFSWQIRFAACILFFQMLSACQSETAEVVANEHHHVDLVALKKSTTISCAAGMIPGDSLLYMQGGATAFEPTEPLAVPKEITIPDGMAYIPGGLFSMGAPNPTGIQNGGKEPMSDSRPIHRVAVDPFFMDTHEVTNAQFEAFVQATGYITLAEQAPTREEFPNAPIEMLKAGSVVFSPPNEAVSLNNYQQWWSFTHEANWRQPLGPGSNLQGKASHPVVHTAWEDAAAYAKWAGKRLPTEAEWEFAARGGLTGNMYAWGNTFKPDGKPMANTFQGKFPNMDSQEDGFAGIAPVKQFAPNGYGLYDMAGNVWEWCADWYDVQYYQELAKNPVSTNPSGPNKSNDPTEPGTEKKVQRGGSFLCTDEYCTRYMMGTRGRGDWRTGTNHVGFRCVKTIPTQQATN